MTLNDEFVLGILHRLNLFSNLDSPALIELGNLFKERIYNLNEVIFQEGSVGETMMVIASGEVRVSQIPGPDKEETLVVLKKGDLFGEMAMLDDLPRSATIIAHTNVICLEIKRDDFLAFVRHNCCDSVEVLLKLTRTLSARLRETDAKLKAFISFSQWV